MSASASGVACSRPPMRSKSFIFSCCSVCLRTALTAGWVTCRLRAAAVIEPAFMMAYSVSSWRSFMRHPSEKAVALG